MNCDRQRISNKGQMFEEKILPQLSNITQAAQDAHDTFHVCSSSISPQPSFNYAVPKHFECPETL